MGEQKEIKGVVKQEEKIDIPEMTGITIDNKDWFLQFFIETANNRDDETSLISLTLNVSGTIISGDLISGKAYFDIIGKLMSGTGDEDTKLREMFSKMGRDVYDKKVEGSVDKVGPTYLHLKNARFFEAGQLPIPRNGTLWRGKVNSIDGFCVGKFEVE